MLIDLAADTGNAQEDAVAEQAERDVDVADAAEDAVAADGVEGLARIPKDEQDKYDVANTGLRAKCVSGDWLDVFGSSIPRGTGDCLTYRSRFEADRCALDTRP